FTYGVEAFLRVEFDGRDSLAFAVGVPREDAALVQIGGFTSGFAPRFSAMALSHASRMVEGAFSVYSSPPRAPSAQNLRASASFFVKVPYMAATMVCRRSSGVLIVNSSPTQRINPWRPGSPNRMY